jgi:tartrate/fumarate subfamily iron-sulfur-dependent hydro-lyase beta chain
MLGDETGSAHMVDRRTLTLPLSAEDVSSLRAGDLVYLNGLLITGRDKVHKYLVEKRPPKTDFPIDISGTILYHCGPIMRKTEDGYSVVAAGPTTSIRVEMYEADVIREYGLRGIMGKGGMGEKTLKALQEAGCVYFHAIGGAAAYLADRIKKVVTAWKLEEFGSTEAMWFFEVKDFPAIVTMDSLGNSMHKEIEKTSFRRFSELILSKEQGTGQKS